MFLIIFPLSFLPSFNRQTLKVVLCNKLNLVESINSEKQDLCPWPRLFYRQQKKSLDPRVACFTFPVSIKHVLPLPDGENENNKIFLGKL